MGSCAGGGGIFQSDDYQNILLLAEPVKDRARTVYVACSRSQLPMSIRGIKMLPKNFDGSNPDISTYRQNVAKLEANWHGVRSRHPLSCPAQVIAPVFRLLRTQPHPLQAGRLSGQSILSSIFLTKCMRKIRKRVQSVQVAAQPFKIPVPDQAAGNFISRAKEFPFAPVG